MADGATVVGNAQEAPPGEIQHGQTKANVDTFRQKERQKLMMQACNLLLSCVLCAAYFYLWSIAEEDCDSKPIQLKAVFLSYGIMYIILILLTTCSVYLMQKMLTDHVIKANIYAEQGRLGEARAEQALAVPDKTLVRCLVLTFPGLCLTLCFGIVWGIICIVSAFNGNSNDNEKFCGEDVRHFFICFSVSMVIQTFFTTEQGRKAKQQAAATE